jgi:hypothetical protein
LDWVIHPVQFHFHPSIHHDNTVHDTTAPFMTRQHSNQSGIHATLNQSIPCLSWMVMLGVILALNLQLKAAQLT